MQVTSIIAVYFLFFVLCAFVMLPFGIRTTDEVGAAKVAGQADSAPGNFRPGPLVIRATIISAALTVIFVLNFEYGWVGIDDINIWPDPPARTDARD